MADGKRPFWMHQLVEYVLGGALVAAGVQSHTPTVPAVLGGIIMIHAAITKGALSAFRVLDRKVHRSIDPFIIALTVFMALQPWISVANPTRFVVLAIGLAHLVVFVGSSFYERPKKPKVAAQPSSGDRSTDLGRSAGRAVGDGVNAVRRWLPKSGD